MDKRALVLGGGGVTGAAWEVGIIGGPAAEAAARAGRAQAAAVAAEVRVAWQER
jgi:hypothetical protein